ncbi:unnamed protein product, partial [Didymodactylos carnosus]
QLYEEMFNEIINNITKEPKFVTIDFEIAVANALKATFQNVTVFGCFFHYKQAAWRKIMQLRLKDKFIEDRDIRHHIKDIMALTFFPTQDVSAEFEILKTSAPDEIKEFVSYFEDNYIGSIARNNRRKPPRFPLSMWNCFERLEN